MSFICILQYTTDTPQNHQYLIYSLETKYKYQISPSKCGNICLQDLVKTRLVTTRWHEAGRSEAARQPTLLIRDPNISDSATMCGEYYQQHSLPPPPRPFVTQAVGHSIYSLYSLYLQLVTVSVCPVSGYWVRIYVVVLKAEEGCSWTGQLLHLHAVAGIKWPHGLKMGPWMHDLISRRQRPTNTGHNVGASGGGQETKRKK